MLNQVMKKLYGAWNFKEAIGLIDVMIIEDDPMVRNINEEFVKKVAGFHIVSSVADIDDGKKYLCDNKVDLILLDVFLPSGSGIEFLKWIRKNEIESDIILITAENGISSINEAFRFGAVDYIVKPFKFGRFEDALNNFKERFNRINIDDKVEQEIIDRYITKREAMSYRESVSNATDGLTKGLNISTFKRIIEFIISNKEEQLTAEFIAEQVGLARVTVRRYLDYMVKEGRLELIYEYGKIGRPTHFYKYIN